eukprot:TRINITY_DN39888_c0_g2_i1.p1 TRINITY_DN39888_c0_g2~~TRINITY_DN39888_c0_g2_i1.p1  ORF type:complete len:437 (+),score=102.15 TRINITY_DN39888_c0_g2_i1:83-1393(+)
MRVLAQGFLCWNVFWLICGSWLISSFAWSKDKFPIKQRWPQIVVASMSLHLFSVVMLNFVEVIFPEHFPVFCDYVFGFLAAPVTAFMMVTRAWRFYFDYNSSISRASTDSQKQAESWFLRPQNRRFGKPENLQISCCILAALYILGAVWIVQQNGLWPKTYSQVTGSKSYFFSMIASIGALSALMMTLSLLLHGYEEDGLHIRKELRLSGCVIFFLVIAFVGFFLMGARSRLFALILMNIASLYSILIQVGYPLALSVKGKKKWAKQVKRELRGSFGISEQSAGESSVRTITSSTGPNLSKFSGRIKMDDILKDEALLLEFQAFLVKELSVENLHFLLDVKKFKAELTENLEALFKELMEKYILENSPFEINIPADIRNQLLNLQQTPQQITLTRQVFDAAQDEIITLLDSDPVRRFRKAIMKSQSMANELSEFRI